MLPVRPDRVEGEHAQHHHAHVAHARVGDQPLPVLLRQRHQRAVDDADDREADHPPARSPCVASGRIGRLKRMNPYVPIFRRTAARMTDPAVGASVCASGSQVWNGNIGTLIENPRKKARNTHHCRLYGMLHRLVLRDVEAVGARHVVVVEVEREDAEQHHHAADQGVQEELDRRVEAPVAAPDADQEVHRHQHDFPEQEEQQEVERDEGADHARSGGRAGRCSTPSRAP